MSHISLTPGHTVSLSHSFLVSFETNETPTCTNIDFITLCGVADMPYRHRWCLALVWKDTLYSQHYKWLLDGLGVVCREFKRDNKTETHQTRVTFKASRRDEHQHKKTRGMRDAMNFYCKHESLSQNRQWRIKKGDNKDKSSLTEPKIKVNRSEISSTLIRGGLKVLITHGWVDLNLMAREQLRLWWNFEVSFF